MDIPETRYARSGDVNIAYQVLGAGPFDLVFVPAFVSNIDAIWEDATNAYLLRRLASFARLIILDKRGVGLSDRVAIDRLPTLEQRMDDVRAVMDAVGSERAALLGHSEGGFMAILFAATYPRRTRAIVLYGAFAKRLRSDDYPWAPTLEERERIWQEMGDGWGTLEYTRKELTAVAPELTHDDATVRRIASYWRKSASPAAAVALHRMNTFVDVRHVLPSVRVPTLVLYGSDDVDTTIGDARYIAEHVPGAQFVEIPGAGHSLALKTDEILAEIEAFLTGVRPIAEPGRFLSTVLFTDIVEGTRKAADLGDHRWAQLVEDHHALVRSELERHRGREIDTAGDGFFASFDGPGRAIRCAAAVRDRVRRLGIEIRAGLHTGECEEIAGKVGGIAVIIGSRVKDQAGPGEVLASSTVKDLVVGSGIDFEDRGSHALKGVPGEWRLYRVTSA